MTEVEGFLERITAWAAERDDVRAALLVGSHALGAARSDSDVDVVLLVDDPSRLLSEPGWAAGFGECREIRLERWGKVTSIRVFYADGQEVEFSVTGVDWVRPPLDEGTARVLQAGFRPLYDPDGLLPAQSPSPPVRGREDPAT